jgi:flagellar assembly protein FliH
LAVAEKRLAKFIKADAAARVDRWAMPSVDGTAAQQLQGASGSDAHLLTAQQVVALQSGAHKEAFDKGYEEGVRRGAAEIQAQVKRLEALMQALSQPFEELDAVVEEEVLTLARVLAHHILRRELKTDTGQIIGAVRDCMSALPSQARNVAIHLHPEDATLVRAHLSTVDTERKWRIEDDPLLERGALRISSDTSQIDGRIESRLNEIVAAALNTGRGSTHPR